MVDKTILGLAFAEVNLCTKVIVITVNGKAVEPVDREGSWLYWASRSSMCYRLSQKWESNFDINTNDCFVVNYESLFKRGKSTTQSVNLKDNIQAFIKSCKGHNVALIVDESHKVKDLQSQQTKSIQRIQTLLQVSSKSLHSYLMTGTPFTKGYVDLYSQLKLLGCTMTKGEFVDRFCIRGNVPGLLGWQQPIVGYRNLDMLYELIHHYAITIKSEDVIDLPEQIFVYHKLKQSECFEMFIDETCTIDKLKNFAKKVNSTLPQEVEQQRPFRNGKVNNVFYRDIDYPQSTWLAATSGQFWLRARELSIGFNGNAQSYKWYDRSRLDALEAFLSMNEDNYVLFYNFVPELLELYDICEKLGYNIDVYCGDIKSLQHYDKYASQSEAEQLTNKKNIILANFASGSTGMNWQAYNKCIIFSCPLYKDYAQGIKRIHRTGQKYTTIYHVFYQLNWLDASMNRALAEAKDYDVKMFESDLARVHSLTSEDNS